jgi:hypothetical protein
MARTLRAFSWACSARLPDRIHHHLRRRLGLFAPRLLQGTVGYLTTKYWFNGKVVAGYDLNAMGFAVHRGWNRTCCIVGT